MGKNKAAGIIASVPDAKWLILVPQSDLLEQFAKHIRERLGEEPGIIGDGQWDPKRITVANIKSQKKRNLTNAERLKRELFQQGLRHINTDSDSEVLLNVLAHELQAHATNYKLDPVTIFKAVSAVHRRCRGAYAVVAMIAGCGVVAFRDPYGIRPLIYGITMFLQQKLMPQSADPVQAKVMMYLPLIFTFVLASMPVGLVIYWSWSNTLGILQQWLLTRGDAPNAKTA